MGILLLIIVVTIEIGYAFFCIVTKTDHKEKRSMIRLTSLGFLILFIVFNVIEWSFRYYGLVFVLTLTSIVGLARLIYKGKRTKEFKTSSVVLKTLAMVIILFVATLPAILFPQNTFGLKTTGMYQVVSNTTTYIDTDRKESYSSNELDRKLNLQFWYPDSKNEVFPLIVFSHGGLGVKSSNESLYNELASHGYVVLSIDHTYHSFFTKDEETTTWIDLGYLQQMLNENPQKDIHESFKLYQEWMKIRMGDINFVIDLTISEANINHSNGPYQIIDTTKIGVMGHSLGGSAALGIGRIREDVQAIVALESPFMFDIVGVKGDNFVFNNEAYPLPVLNIYSDSSWSLLDKRPQYATNHALLSDVNPTVKNKYIKGVGHLSLTDFSLTSPILTRIIDGQQSTISPEEALLSINELCLDFFDEFLKVDRAFD